MGSNHKTTSVVSDWGHIPEEISTAHGSDSHCNKPTVYVKGMSYSVTNSSGATWLITTKSGCLSFSCATVTGL